MLNIMQRALVLMAAVSAVLCSACNSLPAPDERKHFADELAVTRSWQGERISAGPFQLMMYGAAVAVPSDQLTVYIEGDGLAWITASQPSRDPTPVDPIGLRLALAQPDGVAVYLARPCQYIEAGTPCNIGFWTDARFAADVIASTDRAITVLKERHRAGRLTLVGYSGGAAVAALVAARRDDVERIITVAGNLDPVAWAKTHGYAPLTKSLNPAADIERLHGLKQLHFVGANDDNITPAMATAFAALFPPNQRPRILIKENFDHRCCWAEQWPTLWRDANATTRKKEVLFK